MTSPDHNRPLVVLVEDEPDIYEIMLVMFESWDYECIAFVDGEEAIDELPKLVPDLILLDIRLPGEISGIDLLKFVKSTPTLMLSPTIMITAYQSPDIVAETLELGADDFFFKPLPSFEELKPRFDARILVNKLQRAKVTQKQEEIVFISYSRRDWDDYVEPLVKRLQSEGITVWIDKELIEGSDDWLDEINKALKISTRLIVCISPDSLTSRYVKMEYRYAFNNSKRLYPLILRDCELPAELQMIHYYDFSQLDDLIRVLKK